ncbi:MAG: DotI/IcmL/TraM family protein [Micavibrio sp.]|nr:DotI/IcmL/TraM family protein [Micavibrio sp.]
MRKKSAAAVLGLFLLVAAPGYAQTAPAVPAVAVPAKPAGAPSDAAVTAWTKDAAATVLKKVSGSDTDSFQSLKAYFTADGWNDISNAVKKAGIPETHVTKKATVRTLKITDEGSTGDTYSWTLTGDSIYTYSTYDEKDSETDRLILQIAVEFAPTAADPHHIAIAQWQATLQPLPNKK